MNNNKLFEKYINPELGFIKNVCWKYWTRTIEFDELHNEILAIIFRYIHTYNPSKLIRPWLYTVIGREMHRLQKHTWQAPIEYVDLEQYPFSHIQVENDEFAYEDLYAAIESLSPLHNEIISLRMSGYTIKDIAEILYERGLMISNSVNIVSSRINEAYS